MSGNTSVTTPRTNATTEVMDRLRRQILSGIHEAGSMLPGERELSETEGVSRLTLRAALAGLNSEGLVEKVHGAGNRVLAYRDSGGIETLGHLARYALEDGRLPLVLLRDILEFRRFVAIQVLGAVTDRVTEVELAELRAHVVHQAQFLSDPTRFMAEDLFFGRLLVRATHNIALELLYNTATRVLRASPGVEAVFSVGGHEALRVYDRLLDLIEAGDAKRVQTVARRLLEPLDRRMLRRLKELAEITGQTTQDNDLPISVGLKGNIG